ncbi:MAG: Rrf2 family transcriptional regulator, partial [Verrucomicrobia bacterium]|nr:Rrf2 family transcriptional regulator [Verrucomicrobiota bacterium]
VLGVNGGYRIARSLGKVSLLEVMDTVSGEIHAVNCLARDKVCPLETSCNVTSFMAELDTRLRAFYAEISISDLVRPRTQGESICVSH